ncbi:YceI family protein [Actinomadura gamaensis]|uniref:YceI family protein n=1 Tax=Actinomadura gamaensis TaxID=1763541 RepID=A0ABV9U561_9ACTN
MRRITRHWKKWLVAAVAAAVVLAVGGPYVYINLIEDEPPSALSLDEQTRETGTAAGVADLNGTWKVAAGSQAGYRVGENLFGQRTTAVGRTRKVTGEAVISGTRVTAGTWTVDLASVASDQSRRDERFRGDIMNTAQYPDATFKLTAPIDLGTAPPAVGAKITARATGNLTVHGTTRGVTFDVAAQRTAAGFQVTGQIPVTFSDFGVTAPNFGAIQVDKNGQVEFLLTFAKP